MGWNSSTKKMTRGNGVGIGIGDISKAVGSSSRDLGTLIKDGPLINKFAKYKPFIYNQWGFNTDAAWKLALRQTRYGFSPEAGHNAPFSGITWVYNRPQGTSSQPFRALDFDGYYGISVCPFKMEAEVRKGTGHYTSAKGGISILLSVNGAVSTLWDSDTSMGIKDFFNAATTDGNDELWSNRKICFKLENKTRTTSDNGTVIITSGTLSSTFTNTPEMYFYFPEVTNSEWNYLRILDDSQEGDNFEIKAFLYNGIVDQGRDYKVLTGNDASAAWGGGASLAFEEGVDTSVTPVASLYSIQGTTGSITNVTNTDSGIIYPKIQGEQLEMNGHSFLQTISLSIDTTNAQSWSELPLGLNVNLILELKILSTTTIGTTDIWFAPDGDIMHSSAVTDTYVDGYRVLTWRNSILLKNQQVLNYTTNLISPSKYFPDIHSTATDPDKMIIMNFTQGTKSVTFQISARLEKGGETVSLGTSSQYTLTY